MLLPLIPHVRRYAWAHPTAMAGFVTSGLPGSGADPPVAELWFGTHPTGSASVVTPAGDRPLTALVGDLPWMLKVLAIGAPLSLQVHPDAGRARRGYAEGRFPDDRAKPEILLAVTTVRALAGLLADADLVADALRTDRRDVPARIAAAVAAGGPNAGLARELGGRYPDDPAVLAALRLHELRLDPGAAIFVPPGLPHAYLDGLAVELMASSDNVVRGGLSPKPVDVEAFIDALAGVAVPPPRLASETENIEGATLLRFRPPACGFELAHVEVTGRAAFVIRPPAILLGIGGAVVGLAPGSAALEHEADRVVIEGRGRIVMAQGADPESRLPSG